MAGRWRGDGGAMAGRWRGDGERRWRAAMASGDSSRPAFESSRQYNAAARGTCF